MLAPLVRRGRLKAALRAREHIVGRDARGGAARATRRLQLRPALRPLRRALRRATCHGAIRQCAGTGAVAKVYQDQVQSRDNWQFLDYFVYDNSGKGKVKWDCL